MNIQYRIATKKDKNWPQVRMKKFLFWSKWKKIAKHNHGFGLYDLPDTSYPKNYKECVKIIKMFDEWYEEENSGKETYQEFIPARS